MKCSENKNAPKYISEKEIEKMEYEKFKYTWYHFLMFAEPFTITV
jgi:hypothetical protein